MYHTCDDSITKSLDLSQLAAATCCLLLAACYLPLATCRLLLAACRQSVFCRVGKEGKIAFAGVIGEGLF